MRHGWKRLLPALLALMTLVMALPITGFADGGTVVTEGTDLLDGQPLIVPFAIGKTYSAVNYFDVDFTSTNGHYTGEGIFVDTNNIVHLVLRLNANPNYQPIESITVTAGGSTYSGSVDYISAAGNGDEIIINLPGGAHKSVTAEFRLFVLKLGSLDDLGEDFWIRVKTAQGDGGWGIHNEEVTVDTTDYAITKVVDRATATIGDVLTYTVTIANTGTLPLSGIIVTDTVPAGLTATEMSVNGGTNWTPVSVTGGTVTLDSSASLARDGTKTYLLRAVVNENATPGAAVNTATMGGAVPEKSAQATVTIQTRGATITKQVAGNLGDRTSAFPFEAYILKNNAPLTIATGEGYTQNSETKAISFALAHGGSVALTNLPTDGTLVLEETNARSHTVSVSVGSGALTANAEGAYTIPLSTLSSDIAVTNTKDVAIDTGIRLDVIPYIVILALVVALGVIWLIRKRRHGDDD